MSKKRDKARKVARTRKAARTRNTAKAKRLMTENVNGLTDTASNTGQEEKVKPM